MISTGIRVLKGDAKRYGWPTCPVVTSKAYGGKVCGNVANKDGGTRCSYHCASFIADRRRTGKHSRERRIVRARVLAALKAMYRVAQSEGKAE